MTRKIKEECEKAQVRMNLKNTKYMYIDGKDADLDVGNEKMRQL